ncbi:MAG: undecaprenyldiphospho-muramoylpentapeptide beta-N-acetylglucosaminyltransferase [Symbiobacteriaceae bacterium]|nr:undecaprenyldiphospho-muramoylpentapeptide beta-N-acetylglucosaminyltransferase [Symbiobacteriaceae bacterium]
MRLILSGGGSGGHIYPALAIYRVLKERHPKLECLYVGTSPSLEAEIIPREELPFAVISSRGFRRSLSLDTLRTIYTANRGLWQARGIIRRFAPQLVIGTGGYAAGPVVLQAAMLRIPTLIHEQNALPSMTNRILAPWVNRIALTFPEAAKFLRTKKPLVVTGNPVRPEILLGDKATGLQEFALDPGKKTILYTQGSLGSATVNRAFTTDLPLFLQRHDWQVIFATGQKHFADVQDYLEEGGIREHPHLRVLPYIYNMAAALQAADLIISRAGGMIAEINGVGLPAIYIPSPYVADNHQEFNAQAVENTGAALMLREADLAEGVLYRQAAQVLDDPENWLKMHHRALALARPQAAAEIADIAEELAGWRLTER